MHFDDSIPTDFPTNSILNNHAIDTLDKFLLSEPIPTNFLQALFVSVTPPFPLVLCTSSSSHTNAIPILSPLISHDPNAPNPMTDDQIEHDLKILRYNQQQTHNTYNQLIIHQLTQSATTSKSSASSIRNVCTRAQRILLKRYYSLTRQDIYLADQNHSKSHPRHTNTQHF